MTIMLKGREVARPEAYQLVFDVLCYRIHYAGHTEDLAAILTDGWQPLGEWTDSQLEAYLVYTDEMINKMEESGAPSQLLH